MAKTLYHYCSHQAFLSIVKTKSFWCSALSLSSDTMEGRWVHKIFSGICDEHKLEAHNKARVLEMLESLNGIIEGLGFCLSEHGDILSQWRGYAQNAEGFSVGFSKEGLAALSESIRSETKVGFTLKKVNYDIETQRNELEPTYQKIKENIDQGAFRFHRSLIIELTASEDEKQKQDEKQQNAFKEIAASILFLYPKLFEQKNPAFSEESEWRAISPFIKNISSPIKTPEDEIQFRSAGDRIVPYRIFEFQSESAIIEEIVLGPRNQTPIDIIQMALRNFGYKDVPVRISEATYR